MKKLIKTIISLILIIILILTLAIFGMIIYVEMNENDVVVSGILKNGYNLINDIILKKEEPKTEEIKTLEEVVGNNANYKKYYYYEQLNDYSKIIYNKLLENKENMKMGTYKIEFGEIFNELLEQDGGTDQLHEYYQSAIEAFSYDNPDVFYIEVTKMYINIQTNKNVFNTKYNVYINSGKNPNYYEDGYEKREQIAIAESKIDGTKNKIINDIANKSEYEKVKSIHDYLVDNLSYEKTLSKQGIYDIYGALVNKECVCEGYAKAFKYLLDEVNIENIIVIGKATNSDNETENHAWNYVKLDGNWYAVDVTWDDPVITGNGTISPNLKYKFFLLGQQEINKDHVLSNQFTDGGKEYIYPELSRQNYNKNNK